LAWYLSIEVVLATLVLLVWAAIPAIDLGWIGFLILIAIPLWIHFAAVESGNHLLLWTSTLTMLILAITSLDGLRSATPVSLSMATLTTLGYNELVRLNHARRRGGTIDDEIYSGSALAMGLVGLVATAGITIAEMLSAGERTWLWLPVALVAVLGTSGLVLLLPARRAPSPSRERWRPGDRIPPQPLGRDDDLPAL
jgi:hypothetical protein